MRLWKTTRSSPGMKHPAGRPFGLLPAGKGEALSQDTLPPCPARHAGGVQSLYREEIIPGLRRVPGCRVAFLTGQKNDTHELISVTIWNSKSDAEEYEQDGEFAVLNERSGTPLRLNEMESGGAARGTSAGE